MKKALILASISLFLIGIAYAATWRGVPYAYETPSAEETQNAQFYSCWKGVPYAWHAPTKEEMANMKFYKENPCKKWGE